MTDNKKKILDPKLAHLIDNVEKEHGKGSIMLLGDKPDVVEGNAIGSGSIALDCALGIGGYPRSRIVEVYGHESSGKTTLALHAIASVQKTGGLCAFIDAEHAFDAKYARAIGVDPSKLLISQPDYGEQALDISELLAKSGNVDLIVIDSVAALVPKAEVEGDMGDPHVGLHARLMSQAIRKLNALLGKAGGPTILLINQVRQKIGVVFGSPETTTGGMAIKFFSSVRVEVRRIGRVEAGENVVGNRTRAKVVKNKCAAPFNEAEFDIRWGIGIDALGDLIDVAESCGAVQKNGAHYAFGGKTFAQGREKAREALVANKDLRLAVEKQTMRALRGETATDDKKKAA